ncbi:MAG: ribbon-helix-helix protein, CopG family [Candidatus Rokuibacteriota bacterium]
MRTTVRLDDELLRRTKALAAQTGRTLTAVIEDALREALARQRGRRRQARVTLPKFKGSGLQPAIDLDDTAGLLEIMGHQS